MIVLTFFTACSQSGGLSSSGNSGPRPLDDGSSSSTSSTGGSVSGVSMRYRFPNVPSAEGEPQYYVTTFAEVDLGSVKPKEDQKTLSAKKPPQELKIALVDSSDGSKYCFSNDKYTGGPSCAKAASNVVTHIKNAQESPTGQHPVFISALQFNFRNAPASAGGNYSEVIFKGAYVEKAPIVIVRPTGLLATVEDQHLLKLSYGNEGASCNIDDLNSVGFNPPDYMDNEYYLSGLWSFERSGRQVFGNETTKVVEPKICQTSGQQYYCNLFADKINVWHAVIMPILYTNGRVNSRQFPSQVIQDGAMTGSPSTAQASFGRYASNSSNSFVSVPQGAAANAVIGRTDNDGNEITNWQQYFIRKLCLKGVRRDFANGTVTETPLIQAMRFELRSPYVKKLR